jgi:NADH/NAD ratio-sensing transcriptional regulator Rex
LNVGVAARLSRYLQVLTQARKMGKSRISSQEIAEYTNINATQIRRDLSAFGKFGKRGVGYSIESLLDVIRRTNVTARQFRFKQGTHRRPLRKLRKVVIASPSRAPFHGPSPRV